MAFYVHSKKFEGNLPEIWKERCFTHLIWGANFIYTIAIIMGKYAAIFTGTSLFWFEQIKTCYTH